ncbi:hypothetical protein CTEN210_06292 [Chaetoceros tenuissimus]|uniref:Uncharacterized protein n=1 Tax=Chaetoceros tenuissimus TaxID=426638 RepID=A0AAD3H4B0_9STRA|nr:hypothetical protein CTEN210_06292 [Chaetoceros tenuissimus]
MGGCGSNFFQPLEDEINFCLDVEDCCCSTSEQHFYDKVEEELLPIQTIVSKEKYAISKEEDIRDVIVEHIQNIIPEEMKNVEEILSQFQNREEELLGKLLYIQSRANAARKRELSRRIAKRNARKFKNKKKNLSG